MLNAADMSSNLTMSPPDLTMSRTLVTQRRKVLEKGWVQGSIDWFQKLLQGEKMKLVSLENMFGYKNKQRNGTTKGEME